MITYHEVASILPGEVSREILFGFSIGGPTDELHPLAKNSESSLDKATDSNALLSGINPYNRYIFSHGL